MPARTGWGAAHVARARVAFARVPLARVALARVALALAAMACAPVSPCSAQVEQEAPAVVAPAPSWAVTVLRPTDALRPLAARVAVQLRRRTGVELRLGPPPPEVLEAIPSGSLAMAAGEGGLRLVLAGPEGRVASTVLVLAGEGEADVRAVALAVESLQDQLADRAAAPPDPGATVEAGGTTWTIIDPGALTRPRGPERPKAALAVYGSFFVGVSALEPQLLVGPAAGIGLCGGPACFVFEGNAPLVAYERTLDGDTIRYRAADLVARLLVRPLRWGEVWGGASLGVLTRVGRAQVDATGEASWQSSLGVRLTLEALYRFAPPVEWVVEAGVDAIIDPARFIRGTPVPPPQTVTLDETWSLWVVTAIRVRR